RRAIVGLLAFHGPGLGGGIHRLGGRSFRLGGGIRLDDLLACPAAARLGLRLFSLGGLLAGACRAGFALGGVLGRGGFRLVGIGNRIGGLRIGDLPLLFCLFLHQGLTVRQWDLVIVGVDFGEGQEAV